jgi:hypothetical protein
MVEGKYILWIRKQRMKEEVGRREGGGEVRRRSGMGMEEEAEGQKGY